MCIDFHPGDGPTTTGLCEPFFPCVLQKEQLSIRSCHQWSVHSDSRGLSTEAQHVWPMSTRLLEEWVGDTYEKTCLWWSWVHNSCVIGIVYCEEWPEISRKGYLQGQKLCQPRVKHKLQQAYRTQKISEPPYRSAGHGGRRSKYQDRLAQDHALPYRPQVRDDCLKKL